MFDIYDYLILSSQEKNSVQAQQDLPMASTFEKMALSIT